MPRNLTDPNYDDTFEWQERVTDADGDSLSISVTVDGTDISNVSWADYTTTTNTINGDETEVLVDFTADRSGMTEGSTYEFEVTADDGLATTTRTFQLEVTEPPLYSGSRVYMAGQGVGKIFQYSMSTNWDVGTLSYNSKVLDVSAQEDSPRDVIFKPDGTKFFVVDYGGYYEYTMSTAWDVSTGSYTGVLYSNKLERFPSSTYVSPDGTKIHTVGSDSNTVFQHDLSTSWDLSTASHNNVTFDVSSEVNDAVAVFFGDDGSKMFIGGANDFIYQYSLSNPFVVSSATYDSVSISVHPDASMEDFFFQSDGTKLFILDSSAQVIAQFSLTTAWDISSLSYDNKTFDITNQDDNAGGIAFGGP